MKNTVEAYVNAFSRCYPQMPVSAVMNRRGQIVPTINHVKTDALSIPEAEDAIRNFTANGRTEYKPSRWKLGNMARLV